MCRRCGICGRVLDAPGSPLARDAGGDCWGCVGLIEAEGGYEPSIRTVNEEIRAGLRPGPLFEDGGDA